MNLLITVELGNAAMRRASDVRDAIDESLASDNLRVGGQGLIRDVNGNTVGKWEVTDDERDAEALRRFRDAGWEIADDGDPYRPSEVPT